VYVAIFHRAKWLQVAGVTVAREDLLGRHGDVERERCVGDLRHERQLWELFDQHTVAWLERHHTQSLAPRIVDASVRDDPQLLGRRPKRHEALATTQQETISLLCEAGLDGARMHAARLGGAESSQPLA
jgi:hypothetical protein